MIIIVKTSCKTTFGQNEPLLLFTSSVTLKINIIVIRFINNCSLYYSFLYVFNTFPQNLFVQQNISHILIKDTPPVRHTHTNKQKLYRNDICLRNVRNESKFTIHVVSNSLPLACRAPSPLFSPLFETKSTTNMCIDEVYPMYVKLNIR